MKANVGPSREENGIFSVFISVILCSMLGLFSKADPWPNPQEHQQEPKARCETHLGSDRFTTRAWVLLGGFPEAA